MSKSIEDRLLHLEAENEELRRLWIDGEGDNIELKSMLHRFFRLKWYQRLFIKWNDKRLWKDGQS